MTASPTLSRKMIRHGLEALAAVIAIGMLACGLLTWRLAAGPLQLPFLIPHLEQNLEGLGGGAQPRIGEVVVRWSPERRGLRLTVIDLAYLEEGAPALRIPEMEVDLSVGGLLRGVLAPARIEVIGASASIVRDRTGAVRVALTDSAAKASTPVEPPRTDTASDEAVGPQSGFLQQIVDALMGPLPKEGGTANQSGAADKGLSHLEELIVRDATLTYQNLQVGTLWRGDEADFRLRRTGMGVRGALFAVLTTGDRETTLRLTGLYDRPSETVTVRGDVADLQLTDFGYQSAYLTLLQGVDFPVSGTVSATFSREGTLHRAAADLAAGAGTLMLEALSETPLPVDKGAVRFAYDRENRALQIDNLSYLGEANRMTLTGQASLSFAPDDPLRLTKVGLDLAGSGIGVDLPKYFDKPTEIDAARLVGEWHVPQGEVQIETLAADMGPADLELGGNIRFTPKGPFIALEGDVNAFATNDLPGLWPRRSFANARAWVTNRVSGGQITQGRLKLFATPEDFQQPQLPDDVLRFAFTVEGADAIILTGLPPLEDVSADMELLGNTFNLVLKEGFVREGLEQEIRFLEGSSVRIPDLGRRGSTIFIEAALEGRLSDVLVVIDSPRMGFTSSLGLDPGAIAGRGTMEMSFTVPLKNIVPVEEVGFSATAKIAGVRLADVLGPIDVTDGQLRLDIDTERLKGAGQIFLDGQPADISWTENFYPSRQGASTYRVETTITQALRQAMGIPETTVVSGPVGAKLAGRGRGFAMDRYTVALDLSQAALRADVFNYFKPAGQAASSRFGLEMLGDGGIKIKDLETSAPDLKIDGALEIASDGRLIAGRLEPFHVGNTWIDLKASRLPDEQLKLEGRGKEVDLSGPLRELSTLIDHYSDLSLSAEADAPPSATRSRKGLKVDLAFDAIGLQRGHRLEEARLLIEHSGERLERFEIAANQRPPQTAASSQGGEGETESSSLSGTLRQGEGEQPRLAFSSTDAGGLFEGLFGAEQMAGGTLELAVDLAGEGQVASAKPLRLTPESLVARPSVTGEGGEYADPAAHFSNKSAAARGTLKVESFTLKNTPVLAQLLTIGSLRGLSDTLQGEGIWFRSLELPFSVDRERVLHLEEGRIFGPALGLTVGGLLDLETQVTRLRGTLVPSYSVNSALGNLPVVGQLFISREGEGLIGLTYSVSGPPENLRLSVNPLSALAPGFLRRLFQGDYAPAPPGASVDAAVPEAGEDAD